eukprot:scaffold21484_cov123-Isochrysis_galbana.AAC.3
MPLLQFDPNTTTSPSSSPTADTVQRGRAGTVPARHFRAGTGAGPISFILTYSYRHTRTDR